MMSLYNLKIFVVLLGKLLNGRENQKMRVVLSFLLFFFTHGVGPTWLNKLLNGKGNSKNYPKQGCFDVII